MEEASSAVILKELDTSISAPFEVSISKHELLAANLTHVAKPLENFPCERVAFVRLNVAIASSSRVAMTTP